MHDRILAMQPNEASFGGSPGLCPSVFSLDPSRYLYVFIVGCLRRPRVKRVPTGWAY